MLETLTEHVKMIADNENIQITDIRAENVAYAILEDEEIWNLINDRISYLIKDE